MHQSELHGVYPIVDTPFTSDGEVHFDDLKRLAETLAENGCHGLALFGFASEYYKLTESERRKMAEIVVDVCDRYEIPSIISVTAQATKPAVEEAKSFEAMGADVLMLLPPFVRDPPTGAIEDHIGAVAESVSVPIMVQYAPGSTGISLSPDFFASLYEEVENIEYYKIECNPPGQFIDTLHELTDGEANILVGRAGYEMIEGYDRGAIGVMPASAMHDIYVEIHDRYHADDRRGAVDLHSELVAVLNQLTKVGIQWDKRILAERGLVSSSHCRAPESSFDEIYDSLFEEYYERYVVPNISEVHSVNADD